MGVLKSIAGSVFLMVFVVSSGLSCDSAARTADQAQATSPGGEEKMEKATFAAGCFWGVEAAFRKLEGVVSTQVGYVGGAKENPTYKEVCTDRTGHAEAVEVTYDPSKVSYKDLLRVFWETHDPTQLNRQGPDVGTQYRSAVFFHNEEQETLASRSRDELQKSGKYAKQVVTEIVPVSTFYRAEEYHQQYYEKRGGGSCKTR
jgi:peptide-methionine (S)-S-oxide reductase